MLVNVANHVGYVKDTETGVIINNNDEDYKKFLAAREANKKNNNLCKRITSVENELQDIKSLLLQLVHRNN
jgi:hypothetical protein